MFSLTFILPSITGPTSCVFLRHARLGGAPFPASWGSAHSSPAASPRASAQSSGQTFSEIRLKFYAKERAPGGLRSRQCSSPCQLAAAFPTASIPLCTANNFISMHIATRFRVIAAQRCCHETRCTRALSLSFLLSGRYSAGACPVADGFKASRYNVAVTQRGEIPLISFEGDTYYPGSSPWPQNFNPTWVEASSGTAGVEGLIIRAQNCSFVPGVCINLQR